MFATCIPHVPNPTPSAASDYAVKPGDTLYRIANKTQVDGISLDRWYPCRPKPPAAKTAALRAGRPAASGGTAAGQVPYTQATGLVSPPWIQKNNAASRKSMLRMTRR